MDIGSPNTPTDCRETIVTKSFNRQSKMVVLDRNMRHIH